MCGSKFKIVLLSIISIFIPKIQSTSSTFYEDFSSAAIILQRLFRGYRVRRDQYQLDMELMRAIYKHNIPLAERLLLNHANPNSGFPVARFPRCWRSSLAFAAERCTTFDGLRMVLEMDLQFFFKFQ